MIIELNKKLLFFNSNRFLKKKTEKIIRNSLQLPTLAHKHMLNFFLKNFFFFLIFFKNLESSYAQDRHVTYYLVWRQSKWLLIRCNVPMGWMLCWGSIHFQGFLQLLGCFITRRIILWRPNMTSTRINVSYIKSFFNGVRCLCQSNFCWGFAATW